ncbi:MAG TPA: hypothetical protein VMQ61_18750 [Thermoanaerobaculia bacterium]|nr:hypothetical protein [Thermoanaerobaculia bacterium]
MITFYGFDSFDHDAPREAVPMAITRRLAKLAVVASRDPSRFLVVRPARDRCDR